MQCLCSKSLASPVLLGFPWLYFFPCVHLATCLPAALQAVQHAECRHDPQPHDLLPLDHEERRPEPHQEVDRRPAIHAAKQDLRSPFHLCLVL